MMDMTASAMPGPITRPARASTPITATRVSTRARGRRSWGWRYAHNDMCYPFHLSLGQYLLALGSGAYELENTALLMPTVGDAAGGPILPASSARPWSRRGTPR